MPGRVEEKTRRWRHIGIWGGCLLATGPGFVAGKGGKGGEVCVELVGALGIWLLSLAGE